LTTDRICEYFAMSETTRVTSLRTGSMLNSFAPPDSYFLSIMVTLAPIWASRIERLLPMKPRPPVTRTFASRKTRTAASSAIGLSSTWVVKATPRWLRSKSLFAAGPQGQRDSGCVHWYLNVDKRQHGRRQEPSLCTDGCRQPT